MANVFRVGCCAAVLCLAAWFCSAPLNGAEPAAKEGTSTVDAASPAETSTEKDAPREFKPPYPDRTDMFSPPITFAKNTAKADTGDTAKREEKTPHVRLLGFIGPSDDRRAIVVVNGAQKTVRQGEKFDGLELLSLDKAGLTLQWQRARWKLSLDDPPAAENPAVGNPAAQNPTGTRAVGARPLAKRAPPPRATSKSNGAARPAPGAIPLPAMTTVAATSTPAGMPGIGSGSFTSSLPTPSHRSESADRGSAATGGSGSSPSSSGGPQLFGAAPRGGGSSGPGIGPGGGPSAAGMPGMGAGGAGMPGMPGMGSGMPGGAAAPGGAMPGMGAGMPGGGAPGAGAPSMGGPSLGGPSLGAPSGGTPGGAAGGAPGGMMGPSLPGAGS